MVSPLPQHVQHDEGEKMSLRQHGMKEIFTIDLRVYFSNRESSGKRSSNNPVKTILQRAVTILEGLVLPERRPQLHWAGKHGC
jgi:hypothetical protein